MSTLLSEALDALARGWALTPLDGKVPILQAWQSQPMPTADLVRKWIDLGYNLGLRTGAISGVFALDQDKGSDPLPWPLPPHPIARTPGGGFHHLLLYPEGYGNSASKLAPKWDTRGDGGQIVFVGSRHPNGGIYTWEVPPSGAPHGPPTLPLPPVPEEILVKLRSVVIGPAPERHGYAEAALVRESARVRNAPEGTRNATLNRAAFSLGQLVSGGALAEHEVRAALEADAILAGLTRQEAARTIESGLHAGLASPRTAPTPQVSAKSLPPERSDMVLIPGAHVLPGGEYKEIGPADFVNNVFAAVSTDLIYRRGGIPGEIAEDRFTELNSARARLLVTRAVRFGMGVTSKPKPGSDAEPEPVLVFRPLTADHGALIAAGAASDPRVRSLELITPHPVLLPDWTVSPPGWSQGVYYTGRAAPEPIRDHETIRATLADLTVDFPFASEADRQNFYGLLLTPLIRYAIGGPAPMHTIHAGAERAGKTKLAEIVFGGTILGQPTPVFQLGNYEEEREKRIFAMLLSGETVLLLDNLSERIDSPALASLLTANVYRGRTLGRSHVAALPNLLTIVATGNNVEASSELSKRVVPIGLETPPNPEHRNDFKHPDLPAYVARQRQQVLACLLGMVTNWREAGAPSGAVPFGGFEGWARAVGGILAMHGLPLWLTNAVAWRTSADEWASDLAVLVEAWAGLPGRRVTAGEAFELAKREGVFADCTGHSDPAKGVMLFTKRVLSKLPERPVGLWRVRKLRSAGRTRYELWAIE